VPEPVSDPPVLAPGSPVLAPGSPALVPRPPALVPRPVTGSPWGAVAPEGADTALGVAARLGAYCWAEQQVFGLLGGWIAEIAEPDVKLAVAEHADHAAWRAQRWYELLPTAPPGADVLVAPPTGLAPAMAVAAGLAAGPDRTIEKLTIAHRVLLPRLAGALRAHLDWSPAVSEPAVGRMLTIALGDLTADWVTGERLLQALAADPEALGRAAAAQAGAEAPIAAAGGLVGPGSTGLRPSGGAT
jgi:hypothetical protein